VKKGVDLSYMRLSLPYW